MTWQSPPPPAGGPREQPTVPSRTSRRWLAPTVTGVGAVVVAGGLIGYLALRPDPGDGGRQAAPAASVPTPATPGPPPAQAPQVCAMLPAAEVQRLVPDALVSESVQDHRNTDLGQVTWRCDWRNLGYSYGEYLRSREISVKVTLYEARGAQTAEFISRQRYGQTLQSSRWNASKSGTKIGDTVTYYSPVKQLSGIGDEAHAQYTWYKGKTPSAHGSGYSRVGELEIEVEYRASQWRKDSPLFTQQGKQHVTEENALREVELILREVSDSVAAWRQGRPYAKATITPTPSPTPTPTPSPTPVEFPKPCAAVEELAKRLVPDPEVKAEQSYDGRGRTSTLCRWVNREIPAGKGKLDMRSAVITFHSFVNRAGAPDGWAAKQYYIDRHADAKEWEGSGFQGLFYHEVIEPKGLGEQAFLQYRKNRTPSVHAGVAESAVLLGSTVIEVFYGGSQRPKGAPINTPKSVLLPKKPTLAGLRSLTEAVVKAYQGTGTD